MYSDLCRVVLDNNKIVCLFCRLEDLSVECIMCPAWKVTLHCLLRHHPPMNFYYSFLLLLVLLSAYSEGPQYAKPPDPLHSTLITVYPNSSSAQLGALAPVLPQNEVYRITPQHEVYKVPLPQNKVYIIAPPQNEVFLIVLPQNKALTLSEVLKS